MVHPLLTPRTLVARLVRSSAGYKVLTGAALAAIVAGCHKPAALIPPAALLITLTPALPGALRRWRYGVGAIVTLGVISAAVVLAQGWRTGADARAVTLHVVLLAAKLILLSGLSAVLTSLTTPHGVAAALARPWLGPTARNTYAARASVTLAFALVALPVFVTRLAQVRDGARLKLRTNSLRARLRLLPLIVRRGYLYARDWERGAAEALVLRGCRTAEDWLRAAPRGKRAYGVLAAGGVIAAASLLLELLA